jgi:hypothetical protein
MLADLLRYRNAAAACTANAQSSGTSEIAALWASIASSYLFLLRREERLAAEEARGANIMRMKTPNGVAVP